MKKNIVSLLVLFYTFILLPNFAFPQNSVDSTEKFIALSKNNMAINFGFGDFLFSSNYDYYYNVLLTAKYHISDRLALRVSGGTALHSKSGYSSSYSNNDYHIFNIIASINMQYYLSTKTKVKPYFAAGIYTKYDYTNYSSEIGSYYKENTWGIGPLLAFGVEMFVLDNISLNGEYVMKSTYGKYYHKELTSPDGSIDYNYSTEIDFDFKTVRVGTSVYF